MILKKLYILVYIYLFQFSSWCSDLWALILICSTCFPNDLLTRCLKILVVMGCDNWSSLFSFHGAQWKGLVCWFLPCRSHEISEWKRWSYGETLEHQWGMLSSFLFYIYVSYAMLLTVVLLFPRVPSFGSYSFFFELNGYHVCLYLYAKRMFY